MSEDTLLEVFHDRWKEAAYPCLIEHSYQGETILSAASLRTSALYRRHFMRSQGMKPGDIWVQEQGGIEAWINFFACLQGSFIYCPLSLRDTGHEPHVKRSLWKNGPGATLQRQDIFLNADLAGASTFALMLHTSGTSSGHARAVRLEGKAILHQIKTHAAILGIAPESNRWLNLPWFHSFGFVLDGLLGLYAGQHLHMFAEPALHPRAMLGILQKFEIEWLAAVPRSLQILLHYAENHPEALPILEKLHVHSGGAYLAPRTRQELAQVLGAFHWGYGLTECGPGVLMNGHPVGCEVRILADASRGFQELWVRGPSVGYWSGKAASGIEAWIPTGDMATTDASGAIEVLGRAQDCFKNSAGQWIHLREVEQTLEQDLPLVGVHITFQADGGRFIARILTKVQDHSAQTRIVQSLEKLLPLPVQVWVGQPTETMLQNLHGLPQKSLNEALGRLPPEAFEILSLPLAS